MDKLTLVARCGIWELYRDCKNRFHIEGYDKRTNKEYVFPFVYPIIDGYWFSDYFNQYVICAVPRAAISKKAYSRFLATMLKMEGLK